MHLMNACNTTYTTVTSVVGHQVIWPGLLRLEDIEVHVQGFDLTKCFS